MTLSVTDAVAQRKSIRAFADEPVDNEVLSSVLKAALRAPSGGNVQPWRLFVLNGDAMTRFKAQMEEQMTSNPMGEPAQYEIYPKGLKARHLVITRNAHQGIHVFADFKPPVAVRCLETLGINLVL
ncbi:MAG: nitroreductase family protein, partial [Pseudomonadota bacterium]